MPEMNAAHALPPSISVAHLTDAELLAGMRRLVGRSNQLLAELLAHLAEVESRGIHRTRACASLYTYCIYELRFSEDEAFRRVAAARLVKRFPALLDAIATGELHLTGLLMLGPHLTEANLTEVLARAKHRTKRELGRLVRILDPLPRVPARIEPLGPALARVTWGAPTWQAFARSFCPVRNLEPGERPRDWMESVNDADGSGRHDGLDLAQSLVDTPRPAPAGVDAKVESLAPERYKVQFTATEEYVRLVEEAKALLSHAAPRAPLEEIHLRAMRAFVAMLKKRKYATKPAPLEEEPPPAPNASPANAPPRQRGRHIPAPIRRAVYQRDGGHCTYVDPSGTPCLEAHRLEFHHLTPFATGSDHDISNLTLRCAAHNALAADEDFGRERMQEARSPHAHEPLAQVHHPSVPR